MFVFTQLPPKCGEYIPDIVELVMGMFILFISQSCAILFSNTNTEGSPVLTEGFIHFYYQNLQVLLMFCNAVDKKSQMDKSKAYEQNIKTWFKLWV